MMPRCRALVLGLLVVLATAQTLLADASEISRFDLITSTPGVMAGAIGGLVNPGGWSVPNDGELAIYWNDVDQFGYAPDRWGFALGSGLGLGVESNRVPEGPRVYDYQVGFSGGNGAGHLGFAYRWHTGATDVFDRENGVSLGGIMRPGKWGSLGATGFWSTESGRRTGVFDLGIRPLGNSILTLFADWALTDAQRINDGAWTAGAELRAFRLLHFGARFREAPGTDQTETTINVGIALDRLGFHALGTRNEDDHLSTTYLLRFNPPHRGFPLGEKLGGSIGPNRLEIVDLEHKRVSYDKDMWFDRGRVAWLDLQRRLQKVRARRDITGVAINLSGTKLRPSIVWELRREIDLLRAEGKTVLVHIDRATTPYYYVAAGADHVSIDPYGGITLPGVALHRTYLAGTLDKLGVGFEELRYFRYKSANERYSRTDMSEADREQYGRIVDVIYEEMRRGICEGRRITESEYDAIVDDIVFLTADLAQEKGLIDSIGRWDDATKWLGQQTGAHAVRTSVDPERVAYKDEHWGLIPRVSVVYAEGACAMDQGIRGRQTSKYLNQAARRWDVKAVVLRADSPGGDPLPSDLVAQGMQNVRESRKPVVVTQGDVAASGGYVISMRGERVYTTPLTFTGSIGVIAGWVWDNGLGEKIGHSSDGVQRGAHADLFTGIRFPLGIRLPERPLDEYERERAKVVTMSIYDDFVGAVAESRGLPEERVREIGEGRVWMGADAVERDLCDGMGTLADAVTEAAAMAGLDEDDEWHIEEYPPRDRFSWPSFGPELPNLFGISRWLGGGDDPETEAVPYAVEYVRTLAENPGRPMMLVPPDLLPEDTEVPGTTVPE